ncbi:hypothetical protein [Spartinivicinus poritis]|uniref:Uncharacterized protein n=1 Tax=Spartinivicinus poritis TaxID=2994640 RepID=A0ABT5UH95_9GAMM|nr:hypothetical protein [Spartinivicinus sp. A2-2]MDE1465728.1 hypothetical protein [Spartinivicinus sp. A2-2]
MLLSRMLFPLCFGLSISLGADVTFQAGNKIITASQNDIIDAAASPDQQELYTVHIQFSYDFGQKIFKFTSKQMGKLLIITVAGQPIGKPQKIEFNFTSRAHLTGFKKSEAEFVVNHIKALKQQ